MKSESLLCTNFVLIFLPSLNIGIPGNSQCPSGMLAFDRLVKLYTHFGNSFYLVCRIKHIYPDVFQEKKLDVLAHFVTKILVYL